MIVLDNTVVNLALPAIRNSLGFSPTGLAWVSSAYIVVFGGLLLLGGRLGDLLGQRRVLAGGVALFTLASLMGGAAPDQATLVAARALQGIGAAAAAPSALAVTIATFAEGPARNRALGLFFAMSAAGGAVGLILGGALVSALSWRWVLWINVPFGVAVVAFAPRLIIETVRDRHRIDLAGTAFSAPGLAALVYGFVRAGQVGWNDRGTLAALITAVVLLASFVAIENRHTAPLLPLRLFAHRVTSSSYLAMMLVPAVMVGMYFFTAQYLQIVLGYSAVSTGLAFIPMSVLIFASSRLVPKLLPRIGARPLLLTGSALQIGAMLWLSRIGTGSDYLTAVAPPLVFFGLAGGLLYVPLGSMILTGVDRRDSGAASGAMQAVQQVGAALGIAILVSVFGTTSHHRPSLSAAEFTHAVSHAYLTGASLAALTLVLVLLAIRPGGSVAEATSTDAPAEPGDVVANSPAAN